MLSPEQIRKKLLKEAEEFNAYYDAKKYAPAKWIYDTARLISAFIDLPEPDRILLFGNRSYKEDHEELTDGLFPEWKVDKAVLFCIQSGDTYNKEDHRPSAEIFYFWEKLSDAGKDALKEYAACLVEKELHQRLYA